MADRSSQLGEGSGVSPFDTAASATTRFGIELVAWIAGPWAVSDLAGSWIAVAIAVVVLVGLPAIFNTPGDKKATGVPTPGPFRIAIEMFLMVVAVVAAWLVWPIWAFVLVVAIAVAMLGTGIARYRWLLR